MAVGDDVPGETLYLRRYEYTHHSTGKPWKNGPWITWHVVKQPKRGDYIYKQAGRYDGRG